MAFKRIGNETQEWQQGSSYITCDCGKGRETRAELEFAA
jgi:hypothetical protein